MITTSQYNHLSDAYDFFNNALFNGRLPNCLITFRKHGKALGYYSHERFVNRSETNKVIDEIALNIERFDRPDEIILGTLVHEMVHLQQFHFGKPSRGGYHNKEFSKLMESVGLMTSSTAAIGGKRTGPRVSHYIINGGSYQKAARKFLSNSSSKLNWMDARQQHNAPGVITPRITINSRGKEKFACTCGQIAWAKGDSHLICGRCKQEMIKA